MWNNSKIYLVGRQSAIERRCLSESTWVTVVAAVDMMIVVATVAEEEVATIATKSAHTYLGRLFNLRC